MLKKYIFLLLTGLIFGSQFLLTQHALKGFTPMEVGMIRIVFGAIAVALLVPFFAKGDEKPQVTWGRYMLIGFLEATLPCVLVPWGQQGVESSIAGILICTMPIFTMLFGPFLIKSEKFHWVNIVSILAGFIGVVVLANPGAAAGNLVKEIIPELVILLASASWALSLVFIKKLPESSPFILTRNILFAGVIQIIPIWLIFGHPMQIHFEMIPTINALLLGVFASGIVYVFYVLLIRMAGVNFAAFSNYLVPIVAGVLGVAFLGEHFTKTEVIGFAIIMAGLALQTAHDFGWIGKK